MNAHFKPMSGKTLLVLSVAVLALGLSGTVFSSAEMEDLTLLRIDSPRFTFLQECSRCHEPERGYQVIGNRMKWEPTVRYMAGKNNGWITPAHMNEILRYGSEYPEYQQAFFHERCGGCHDWEEIRSLGKSAAEWRAWIKTQRHVKWITSEECGLILCGIGEGS